MIPSNWNEITVSQFQELRLLGASPSDSLAQRYIDTLLTVTDIDLEELEEMPIETLSAHIDRLKWVRKEPHKKYAKKVGDYTIIDFKKVTWGMFIDLEHYYSNDFIENLPIICGILYRQQKKDEWRNVVIEPYEYDPKLRAELFRDIPITSVYGVATSYLSFRNDLINDKYANLFDSGLPEEEAPEDPQERKQWEEDKQEEEKFNKWSYETVTLNLANGDFTKMDDILNKSLIYVLNMLSMKAELD